MEIQNFKIAISDDCSEINKTIIYYYWELNEKFEIVNTPKSVKSEYDVSQSILTKLLQNYCKVSFYQLCKKCNSYELKETTSHSDYKHIISDSKYNDHSCNHCITLERRSRIQEEQERVESVRKKLNHSINEKVWNNLDEFHTELLFNCLNFSFSQLKSKYWKKLGANKYPGLFRGLHHLAELDLLIVNISNWDNKIEGYQYLERLKNEFEYITPIKKTVSQSTSLIKSTNQLKFKLTNNNSRYSLDSPKYSGTVIFKERIIIEPNVEYSFAHWDRSNQDLFLTLIPTGDIYPNPIQQRMSDLPITLQEGIQDFFDNIKPEF